MKEWERNLRREQKTGRCSLGNRLLYAFIGFVSAGALSFFVFFMSIMGIARVQRYIPPYDAVNLWIQGGIAGVAAGFTLFFTAWGFLRGDRMIETLGDWWDDIMNRDRD